MWLLLLFALIFTVIVVAIMHVFGKISLGRHFRRLAESRNRNGLSTHFESVGTDLDYCTVIPEVEKYFQEIARESGVEMFPVSPNDLIEDVYSTEVEEVLDDCLSRCARRLPDRQNESLQVQTVADLIRLLVVCPSVQNKKVV